MKVGSQPGLKVSTWVNPSRSYRPRRFGWQSSRSLAHPCVFARHVRQALDQRGADTPARMCPSPPRACGRYAGLPLEGVGPELGILGRQGANSRRCRRCNSRLGARISGRRSPRMSGRSATSQAGVPWRTSTPQRRASAAQPRRYHPSRRPERSEAPRCPFAPWRGMNRRIICAV